MFATIINKAIVQGIPLLYGSTGEILTEKSGNLNLGIPGIMYMGGSAGVIGAYLYERSVEVPVPFWCIGICNFLYCYNNSKSLHQAAGGCGGTV